MSIINSGPTSSQRYSEGWVDVIVTDGRLTVSNAAGAVNNKIDFIDILPLGLDLSAGFGAACPRPQIEASTIACDNSLSSG